MRDFFTRRDVLSGLLMTGVGTAFLATSLSYPLGTARSIGAGAFPAGVAALLVLVGLGVIAKGALRGGDARVSGLALGPLGLIVGGLAAFALLLPTAGFIAATVALILLCSRAHPAFNWPGALALSAVVTVFGAAVFIYGLGLPLRLIGPLLRF